MAETSKKFEVRRLLAMNELNREQLDNEIAKGMTDIEEGRVYLAEDVEKRMREMYSGIEIKEKQGDYRL